MRRRYAIKLELLDATSLCDLQQLHRDLQQLRRDLQRLLRDLRRLLRDLRRLRRDLDHEKQMAVRNARLFPWW